MRATVPNRLADEPSPYLRQHAQNPVDWWPWCDEAFEEARRRHVPVFVSIGYATCHWCHVMAHECFEDAEVAALMNEAFVNVKVDREERPDVDDAYMAVCQAMTGSGGWPLNVVVTPERRPWFAGTYFPKHTVGRRLGMMDLVPRLREAWQTRRADIEHQSEHVLAHVSTKPPASAASPDDAWLDGAFEALRSRFDAQHGGFGGAPKFPSAHNLLWLLRHHRRTGDGRALELVRRSLDGMAAGGVHDHVGGGFHRYSTDAAWFLPHFEKMLYDQAMLLRAYAAAYAATGDDRYQRVAAGIVGYLERDLRHHDGGFFSAEDADSEGEEGKFYVWSLDELREVLGDEAEPFAEAHGARPGGNFRDEATGEPMPTNVLHLPGGLPQGDPWRWAYDRLREVRAGRVRPLLDDKVLTDWNGLAVGALADAAVATGNERWLRLARDAADFVLAHLRRDGRLLHRWHDGRTDDRAFLDDHAFLGDGLLRLFEATQHAPYLAAAREVADALLRDFEDDPGGFRLAPPGGDLEVARVEAYDGAIPSGNAVAAGFLWRLGRTTGEARFEDAARRTVDRFSAQAAAHPGAFTTLLETVEAMLGGGREVVVCGDGPEAEAMLHLARERRVAGQVVLRRTDGVARLCPWVEAHPVPEAGALAYVCRDRACQAPVDSVAALSRALS